MAALVQPGTLPPDQSQQINTYRSYVSLLIDPNARDENKLKAAQELSEDLEVCLFLNNQVLSKIHQFVLI